MNWEQKSERSVLFRVTVKHNESDFFFFVLIFVVVFYFCLFASFIWSAAIVSFAHTHTLTNRIKEKKTKNTKRNRQKKLFKSAFGKILFYIWLFFLLFSLPLRMQIETDTRAHTQSQRSRRTAWRFNCCGRIANTLLSSDNIALTAVWDVFVDVRTPIERRIFEIFIFAKNILFCSTHLHLKCHTWN